MARWLFLLILLSGCNVIAPQQPNVDIFCDSQGDDAGEYVDIINGWRLTETVEGLPHFRNRCLAGLSTAHLQIPEWLNIEHDTLVVMNVSHNDALFSTPLDQYEAKLIADIEMLDVRGIKYVCVLAPEMTHANIDSGPYRAIQAQHCALTIDVPLFLDDKIDGLHMGPQGQFLYAMNLIAQLEPIW